MRAAAVLFGLICAGLVVPLLLSGKDGDQGAGGNLRAADRERHALTQPVELLDRPRIVVERGILALASGGRGSKLLSLLTGGGADLMLDNAKIVIGTSDRTTADEETSRPPGAETLEPVITALRGLSFRTLYLDGVSAVVRLSNRPDEILEDVSGEISKDRKGAIKAKLKFVLRGEELFADIALGAPGDTADAQTPLSMAIKGKHLSLALDGRLVSGDRLQVTSSNAELSVPNLRQAARWLDRSWPSGQGLGKLTAQGPVTIDEKSISFENARLTVDGNTATGSLSLTLGSERPAIEGTLAFDNLDVGPYIETQKTGLLALAGAWISSWRIAELASPSLIHQLNADMRISARSLAVGSDKFGRCAASISIQDGKLFGELAEMEFDYGGSGEGQFGADMTLPTPRYTLRLGLDGIDMGRAVGPYVGDGPGLEGLGDVIIDVSGEGATSADILASLGGSIAVGMREGARLGINLDALSSIASGKARPAGWAGISQGSTSVDTLTARFSGTRGLFTVETVEASSAGRMIRAAGTVSPADGTIDLTVSVGPGKAETRSTDAGVPPSPAYRLEGRWAAPAITRIPPPGKSAYELEPEFTAPEGSAPAVRQIRISAEPPKFAAPREEIAHPDAP